MASLTAPIAAPSPTAPGPIAAAASPIAAPRPTAPGPTLPDPNAGQSGTDALSEAGMRIAAFVRRIQKASRSGADSIAARLDIVSEALSGRCDGDTTADIDNSYIPIHVASTLRRLQADRPDVYKRLAKAARDVADADIEDRRRKLREGALTVVGDAPPPPLPPLTPLDDDDDVDPATLPTAAVSTAQGVDHRALA